MAGPADNLTIDPNRLWASLERMAEIGPGLRGGNNRQTVTDADGEGRALFKEWCEAAGMTVSVDRMGNMFARREGADPEAPPVYAGSHLDTQPTGGRYDGVLGTLGALEMIRTLNERGVRTRHPIVVVNWTNEEGTRFAPPLLGSAVFIGEYDLDWAYDRRDAEGARFGDELARIGWRGEEPVGGRPIKALFELHIEQGPILEAEGLDVGVVVGGQGQRWIGGVIAGQEAHAGSTPMTLRKDAGLGFARIVELANRLAMRRQPNAVGTVGRAVFHPNSANIIAGQVAFTADLRSPDAAVLQEMEEAFLQESAEICETLGLGFESEILSAYAPPVFDPGCVAAVRGAAEKLGYKHRDMISGAGHDATLINRIAPTAMIFCPCVDGLSHNEDEAITPEWAAAGVNVLTHAVLETAEVVS